MNKEMGFGIIGLGMIADIHAKAIASLPGCKFVAGYDVIPGKAKQFCSVRDAKDYSDLSAFFADPSVQIVTITTPSGAHLDVAMAAIEAGKHVIIEKPLEVTVERCDRLIEAAQRKGVVLGSVFQSRFYDAPRLVKEAIDQGRFGKITLCDAQVKWFRTQQYYDSVSWRGTWKLDGGGALMNQSIHAIDLLQWFGGPVDEVSGYVATLGHERIEVEDSAVAILRFHSGALGVVEASTATYPGFFKKLEICGTEGSATLEEESLKNWHFLHETEEDERIRQKYKDFTTSGGGASDPAAIEFKGHAKVFQDVVNSVREHHKPLIDGEEARKSVAIIEAIYTSARLNQPIQLAKVCV